MVALLKEAIVNGEKERFLIDGFPRSKDNLEAWFQAFSDDEVQVSETDGYRTNNSYNSQGRLNCWCYFAKYSGMLDSSSLSEGIGFCSSSSFPSVYVDGTWYIRLEEASQITKDGRCNDINKIDSININSTIDPDPSPR